MPGFLPPPLPSAFVSAGTERQIKELFHRIWERAAEWRSGVNVTVFGVTSDVDCLAMEVVRESLPHLELQRHCCSFVPWGNLIPNTAVGGVIWQSRLLLMLMFPGAGITAACGCLEYLSTKLSLSLKSHSGHLCGEWWNIFINGKFSCINQRI